MIKHRRKQYFFFFLIVWLHMSLLDLFFITPTGPVFMVEENTRLLTLLVHFSVALASWCCLIIAVKLGHHYQQGQFAIKEPILIFSSIAMLISIGFLLI